MYKIMGSTEEQTFMAGYDGLSDLVAKRKNTFTNGTTLVSFLLDNQYIETACDLIVSDYAEEVLFDSTSDGFTGFTQLLLSGNHRIFHAFCISHPLGKVTADKLQIVFQEMVPFYDEKIAGKQELGYNPYNVFTSEQFGDMDLSAIIRIPDWLEDKIFL